MIDLMIYCNMNEHSTIGLNLSPLIMNAIHFVQN